jgi:hypothetical protein
MGRMDAFRSVHTCGSLVAPSYLRFETGPHVKVGNAADIQTRKPAVLGRKA